MARTAIDLTTTMLTMLSLIHVEIDLALLLVCRRFVLMIVIREMWQLQLYLKKKGEKQTNVRFTTN